MSTHKSSMTTGAPAMKTVDWTKVLDEELATDIDDTDLRYKGQKRRDERPNGSARRKRQKNAGRRRRRGDKRRQRQSRNRRMRRGDKPLLQRPESNSGLIQRSRQVGAGRMCVKKWSVCGSCTKAKERCEWPEVEMMASRAGMSPWGGERKKQMKKVDGDDDDEVVILSSQKTKRQGGGETLEEVTDQWWGELIQAVSSHMDIANGHLEQIVSAAQSNGHKMQQHHLLMEGLVGQQQMLVSRLVEIASAAGSGGAGEVIEGSEELKEPQETQGEGSGGQEGTEGAPGEGPGGVLEDALGDEPENGARLEDGAGEEGQQSKGKEKAL
ncbi:hypothetical protein ID866_11894 [Astraeus odoratus]|nr:hypothetical protein ID866_11894 [Astraeus odoratus]